MTVTRNLKINKEQDSMKPSWAINLSMWSWCLMFQRLSLPPSSWFDTMKRHLTLPTLPPCYMFHAGFLLNMFLKNVS
jgi:hypothetical protein